VRRISLLLVMYVLTAVPALADPHGLVTDAGTAKQTRLSGYYSAGGGEYTFFTYGTPGLQITNAAYDAKTRDKGTVAGSFQTFCIEKDEVVYNEKMQVYVSQSFLDDSVPGSHAWAGGINTNDGDDLDPRTAYLYTQFAKGVLSDYDYTPGASRRSVSAGQLQNVLWYIEEEIGAGLTPEVALGSGSQALLWYNEAVGAGWDDIGNVRVLQLFKATDLGQLRQDQLYLMLPVPGAVLLGAVGLIGAGLRLRRSV
jgi:hypothetical protein